MMSILGPFLTLATEGLKFANTKMATKYRDELLDLQKQIIDEEAKGYHSDDQKLVVLYKKLTAVAQAAVTETAPHA